jgi:2-C-methyl-D-erythritol 2,4-cyclodiphosphate synthase
MRVGMGYDVHRLVEHRPLILGGVRIPFEKGLLGHSDADVLLHAVADSLLGAAGLGDIGRHFPDADPAWKDADSLELLARCAEMVREKGYAVANVDATLLAQAPKIAPYREAMRERIAAALGIEPDRVNVKATTTERLGFVGTGEGMAALCVALLERKANP